MSNPLVSILMLVYNHEPFVVQALDSALVQQTNFRYEIIIGEDCSTDKSRDILKTYAQKYPDKIKLILRKKNVGMIKNFTQIYQTGSGKYAILLEGDDFWTDPNKLQKQVDFLETHSGYVGCYHNVDKLVHPQTLAGPFFKTLPKSDLTIYDLLGKNSIPTCSVLFRHHLIKKFPTWLSTASCGDWWLHLLNADHGNFYYLNETMGVYRIHLGGMNSQGRITPSPLKLQIAYAHERLRLYPKLDATLAFRYHAAIQRRIRYLHAALAVGYGLTGRWAQSCQHVLRVLSGK